MGSPKRMLSRTEPLKIQAVWATSATDPLMRRSPETVTISPRMALTSVDLPEPTEPAMPTRLPRLIERETSTRASLCNGLATASDPPASRSVAKESPLVLDEGTLQVLLMALACVQEKVAWSIQMLSACVWLVVASPSTSSRARKSASLAQRTLASIAADNAPGNVVTGSRRSRNAESAVKSVVESVGPRPSNAYTLNETVAAIAGVLPRMLAPMLCTMFRAQILASSY
mmetsp:Transcript_11558/g.37078  ORF Transcript_11558/g.37078 Transcript_11558/m.37078 type:complete len:229 (+) Transcript_11558:131-817(+)